MAQATLPETNHTPDRISLEYTPERIDHLQREVKRLGTLASDNFEKALGAMEEVERLKEVLLGLLMALAARPDCTRLFGPHEMAIYERARNLVNAAISEQEGK